MRHINTTAAKVELKKRGHSYRSASREIGRSYQWICQVLNGKATSQPVLDEIFRLPVRIKKEKETV
jgi:lambda repressor-like predicted transcriptional regulator